MKYGYIQFIGEERLVTEQPLIIDRFWFLHAPTDGRGGSCILFTDTDRIILLYIQTEYMILFTDRDYTYIRST